MAKATKKSPKAAGGKSFKVIKKVEGCWIDVFEKPWFTGKLKRLRGPGRFGPLARAGSLIVGPTAKVLHLDAHNRPALQPRQIVPELAKPRTGGEFRGFLLVAEGRK
jgi:hypothetical protein